MSHVTKKKRAKLFSSSIGGFSLGELMVVVTVIGLLSTMGSTYYKPFKVKARRAEAYTVLGIIFTLQKSYHADNVTFGNLGPIGHGVTCEPVVNDINFKFEECDKGTYQYQTTLVGEIEFEASAASTLACKNPTPDLVTINENKENTLIDCTLVGF